MSAGEKGPPRSRLDNPLLAAESSKLSSTGSSSYQRLLSTSSVTSEKDGDAEKQNTKVASQHSRDSATVHEPSSISLTTSSSALVGIGTGKRDLTGASKWKGDSGKSLQLSGSGSLLGKSPSLSSGSSLKSSLLSQQSWLKVSQLSGGSLTSSSVKSSMSLFTGGSIRGNLSSSKLASSSLLQSTALSHSSFLTSTSTLKASSGCKLTATLTTPKPSDKNRPKEARHTGTMESKEALPDTKGFSHPQYDFSGELLEATQVVPLSETLGGFADVDSEIVMAGPVDVATLKCSLINFVAASLISAPNFREPCDSTRVSLMSLCQQVIRYDAEFVLKVALYTRCELNIRATANFLLAVSSNSPLCRPFLRKYYSASIRLPSDWIDVAELYQAFHDKSLNFGSLPTALRKAMIGKFTQFDAYQLAKYNKEKKKKTAKKDDKMQTVTPGATSNNEPAQPTLDSQESVSSQATDGEDQHTEEELTRLSFTLKQLIRKLHIREPVEHVMCLIGKKYPDDLESFYKSKLPGTFDETRAGKRMKLPTPETWETQVSLKGNKASTWEDLIDHNKLPFMAMLRNLRNLILAGISQKHHSRVIKRLTDEISVIKSRQFPFRFFSAFEVLSELEKLAGDKAQPVRRVKTMTTQQIITAKRKAHIAARAAKIVEADVEIVGRYCRALDTAVKIATRHNVKPIRGRTVIFCHVGQGGERPCTSFRGMGKPRTILEVGLLLGLMCKYACEECDFRIFGNDQFVKVSLTSTSILEGVKALRDEVLGKSMTSTAMEVMKSVLMDMLRDRVQIDNLIILHSDGASSEVFPDSDYLHKYRRLVNANLLYVNVDLGGARPVVAMDHAVQSHENDIHICGYSDQILRFVAERGGGGQLLHVEQIDQAYDLKGIKVLPLPQQSSTPPISEAAVIPRPSPVPKWRTVRVFISSTFKDMHGERDLLTRFVFPELRARAKTRFINVYEVDLRWGVTEKEMHSDKGIDICLSEVAKCDFFIGLLGDRYGWIPSSYVVSDTANFDWVKEYPPGRSITELEIQQAIAVGREKAEETAFFYFRDSTFLSNVPESVKPSFTAENPDVRKKIVEIKEQIRKSGCEVFDDYPCHWGGVVDGKPMVTGLEQFGSRVLNNLWTAITREFPDEDAVSDQLSEEESLHASFAEQRKKSFVGRKNLLKQAQSAVERVKEGVIAFVGKEGCGRTSLMSAFLYQYADSTACTSRQCVISHFVGVTPGSTNIATTLSRIMLELKSRFHLPQAIPNEFHEMVAVFPKFFMSAVEAAGISSCMVLFVDGLDMLDAAHQAHTLEWLPDPLPKGVVFVVSVVDGGQCAASLNRRTQKTELISVGGLDMFDKAEVVRQSLKQHRKSLDESPFNNQLKLLLSKRDATVPLFLSIACEELRVFGVFEKVSEKLKKMPASLNGLLQDVLQRLESDLGQEILSVALLFLCCCRTGLTESELISLLRLHQSGFLQQKQSPLSPSIKDALRNDAAGSIPQVRFAHLVRSLQSFLQPTAESSEGLLVLAHTAVIEAVKHRYKKGFSSEQNSMLHLLLAAYFYWEADPKGNKSFDGSNKRAMSELPYHLTSAGLWSELETVVCSLQFIEQKCLVGLGRQLPDDFLAEQKNATTAQQREHEQFLQQQNITEYHSFVSRNLHIISRYPKLCFQQALNEPSCSVVSQAAHELVASKKHVSELLAWVNKPEGRDLCRMTLTGFNQAVTCVAVSPDKKHVACGSLDCTVRLYNLTTGKEVKSFVGHGDAISSCCFAGNSRLCSAALDGKLSLWDVQEGHRVSLMKRHNRLISSCAADPAGKLVVSVGWDSAMFVWNAKDGKQVSELKGEQRPINCVDFHPEGQFVVTGSWDASLKIWDTLNRKRIKRMQGHKSAVRAVVYSPTSRHIASASLDGEVKLWSAQSGTQVGSISGHSMPINQLCFTHLGHHLVTVSDDRLIKVWSGQLGKPVDSITSDEKLGGIQCLSISPNGEFIGIGYHEKSIRVCRVEHGTEVCILANVHDAGVDCIAWSADGQSLVSGSDDNTLKIFNMEHLPTVNQLCTLTGHEKGVWCVAWSGQWIASGSEDFTINVYSISGLKKLKLKSSTVHTIDSLVPSKTLRLHTAPVTGLCFTGDGKRLISCSRDRSVVIWNASGKGKPERVLQECHKDWISACALADNDSYLVTASNDFTLKVWSLITYTEKAVFTGHVGAINSVAIKAGCIVSASVDGTVKVWSHRGIEITTLHGNGQRVNACAVYVPENKRKGEELSTSWAEMVQDATDYEEKSKEFDLEGVLVASGGEDGTVRFWKALQGHQLCSLVGHSDRVIAVATNGTDVITSALDNTLKIWSLKIEDSAISSICHNAAITSVVMSNCTNWALSSSRDGSVTVWRLSAGNDAMSLHTGKQCSFKAHEKAVNAVCCLSTSTTDFRFATCGDDGTVALWSHDLSKPCGQVSTMTDKQTHSSSPVTCLAYNEDTARLVSGGWDGAICVWIIRGRKANLVKQLTGGREWILCVAFVNPSRIVCSTAGNRIAVWDLSEFKWVQDIPPYVDLNDEENSNKCWPTALCVPQGPPLTTHVREAGKAVLLVGDNKGVLSVRDSSSGEELGSKKTHTSTVTSIAVGANSIYSASSDGTLKIWNPVNRQQVGQFFCRAPVTSLSVVSVGGSDKLITGDILGNVEFFDNVKR